MIGLIYVSILLIERRNPPKFLLLFLSVNQIMWRRCLSSVSLLKKRVRRVRRRRRRRRRRRGGVKGERKRYLPLSMLLLL
jgi:hypothetical protein